MRLAILGDPVAHSLSPLLHTIALRQAGLEGTYERRRVDAAGMAAAVGEIRDGHLDGANVTMPHKELAAELSDRLAVSAGRAGAVNTLVRAGGMVVGHNTDVAGVRAAWEEAGLPAAGPVLILGAGGAAAAALLALDGNSLFVSARREGHAAALVARVGVAASTVPWGAGPDNSVIVNATPIGMNGERLHPAILDRAIGLFDMAYGPHPTPSVTACRARHLPVADGRRMLLHQAAVAFELWTGHLAPLEAMAEALAE